MKNVLILIAFITSFKAWSNEVQLNTNALVKSSCGTNTMEIYYSDYIKEICKTQNLKGEKYLQIEGEDSNVTYKVVSQESMTDSLDPADALHQIWKIKKIRKLEPKKMNLETYQIFVTLDEQQEIDSIRGRIEDRVFSAEYFHVDLNKFPQPKTVDVLKNASLIKKLEDLDIETLELK